MGSMMLQWNNKSTTTTATINNITTNISIFIIITILLLLEPVHGLKLELLHRHHERFVGDHLDRAETVKGFVHRDNLRRQRWEVVGGNSDDNNNNYDRRRMGIETLELDMPMHSGRDYGLGEYFVEVKVGTPEQRFWLAADTGSEFTWFNCAMRNNAAGRRKHKKKHSGHKGGSKTKNKSGTKKKRTRKSDSHKKNPCDHAFCPHKSQTFEAVTCASRKCKVDLSELFSLSLCPKPTDPCLYDISYADGSSAKGFFGTDTITVDLTNGKHGKLHNLTIGCTKTMLNGATFNQDTGGILGLGYAKDSFIDKAGLEYGAQFSYCLVDHLSHRNVSSYLTFNGNHNAKLLSEMQRTELVLFPPFYGVHVVGISVGDQKLKIPPQVWDFNAQGGTIIDSGTTLTALLLPAYDPVFEALTKSLTQVKRLIGEDFGVDFCFDAEGFDESVVPRLAFHFAGGTRFEPPVKSYIIDVAPQVKCIGIVPINGEAGASVIGNIMQQNHLWEFDLSKNTVGFAPSICN